MFILLSLIFIVFLIILIPVWYIYMLICMWKVRHLPGPKPLPIIGCAYKFPNVQSMLNGFQEMVKTYGSVCKMMVGIEPSILISDYELVETILRSPKMIEKSKSYRHFHNWLGFGLLTSGGDKWRLRRKLLTPTYHFKILESFLPVFDSVGNNLVLELRKQVDQNAFDIYPYITLCTLDIICETAMGTSVNALINHDSEYVKAVKGMCNVIMEKVFSPIQHHPLTFKLTKNYKKEKELLTILNDYTMNVIKRRKIEMHLETSKDDSTNKKIAFLDLLLQTKIDGEPLSDEDLREEVSTFMFEGHDTTASALSFALYNIANHQEVQAKLIEEQINIFGNNKACNATYKDLSEMKYLEMVIKETLRLYPSVPFYARETQEEITLGKLTIPKNFTLIIFAMAIQRNSKFYPNSEEFIPERWNDINGCHPFSYIPFSAGHRNCIGQKFAMLEMKVILSKFIRNFELFPIEPKQELILICETILKSSNGMQLSIKERMY